MRFIHAADIHLDTAFSSRSQTTRARLRDASREAFRRLADLAIAEHVDAVLLAGDLFDDERLSFQTERFLLDQLQRLGSAGIPVVYATGNHDPGREGLRSAELPWPENVTVARDREPVRLTVKDGAGEPTGVVTVVGHASSSETEDLSALFPAPEGRLPEVAVLHTQVLDSPGSAEHGKYAPSSVASLEASGHDYWALGHVHMRSALREQPGIHYPGNLQGRTHRERGPKGCLLVDLGAAGPPTVEFRELAPIRWQDLEVRDPAGAATLDALVRSVSAQWEEAAASGGSGVTDWIARIRISGATPLWRELSKEEDQDHLREELMHRLGVLDLTLRIGSVHPLVRVEDHFSREDVLGQALHLIARVRSGEDALSGLPPERLIGLEESGRFDEYVGRLLESGEGEVLSRMLKIVAEDR